MIKPVSVLAITIVGMMSVFPSNGAPMTSQIQRLLDQKEEKIKQLEECEGKKQGWMIAGISTIGLTAVGVGVNIAQASKSNKLSGEIEQSKQELERQQEKLSRIESQISKKESDGGTERGVKMIVDTPLTIDTELEEKCASAEWREENCILSKITSDDMYIYRCPIKLEGDRIATTFATIGNVDCLGFQYDHDCAGYNRTDDITQVVCFDEENAKVVGPRSIACPGETVDDEWVKRYDNRSDLLWEVDDDGYLCVRLNRKKIGDDTDKDKVEVQRQDELNSKISELEREIQVLRSNL